MSEKITVKLVGKNGNAYNLLAIVRKALRENGMQDKVEEFTKKATSGDYDHLLATCCEYVNVE